MLIKILVVLAVVLLGLVVFAATRPSEFRVMRSALVGAPPDAVFPHVNDLHNWEAWSPWAKLDPEANDLRGARLRRWGCFFMGWQSQRR